MLEKRVLFDRFEFPVIRGLNYLMDDKSPTSDYLFINDPHEKFSMYFEVGQKHFNVTEKGEKENDYCLFQIKRTNRTIHFYCPERLPNRESVMWYFYVEILDENGELQILPGQIRLSFPKGCIKITERKSPFIKILEQVELKKQDESA